MNKTLPLLLGAHAGGFPALLLGRILQGCSGGAFPALFGLARGSLPAGKLPGAVAGISTMFGVGGALGMVVAGPLVDVAGTPALFWFSLLLGVLSLAGLPALSDGDRAHGGADAAGTPDVAGAVLLTAALVTLLLGVSQGGTWGWASPATLGLLSGSAVLFGLLALVERRAPGPLVDLSLVTSRPLVWTNLATLVISVGMFAAVTLLPRFVQAPETTGYGFGFSPSRTGLLLVPTAVMMVLAAPVATNLSRRFSAAGTFRCGALLAAVALTLFALAHGHVWTMYLGATLLGLAYGLAFASLGGLVVGAVGQRQTGAATGIKTILRTIGGALGAQVAAVILENSVVPASGGVTSGISPAPTEGGFTVAFLASAAVALVALVTALGIRRGRPDRHSSGQ